MKKTFSLIILLFLAIQTTFAQNKKVAVIGAGISGLSSAHFIRKFDKNAEITIFEKEKIVGGNARTITLQNNGENIYVDLGPQFFADGPWDNYISLLKEYELYNENEISKFAASVVINNSLDSKASFVSPRGASLRGEKASELMQFIKFYSASRKVYLEKEIYSKYIGEWVILLTL